MGWPTRPPAPSEVYHDEFYYKPGAIASHPVWSRLDPVHSLEADTAASTGVDGPVELQAWPQAENQNGGEDNREWRDRERDEEGRASPPD
jgi:hypothetical protein